VTKHLPPWINSAMTMFQVGPPDMWQNHQDLITLGKRGKDMEVGIYLLSSLGELD
jgi:hypothetical protein